MEYLLFEKSIDSQDQQTNCPFFLIFEKSIEPHYYNISMYSNIAPRYHPFCVDSGTLEDMQSKLNYIILFFKRIGCMYCKILLPQNQAVASSTHLLYTPINYNQLADLFCSYTYTK